MAPRLLVVLFVILVEFSTGLAESEGGVRVWAVPSIQKIRPNDPIECTAWPAKPAEPRAAALHELESQVAAVSAQPPWPPVPQVPWGPLAL